MEIENIYVLSKSGIPLVNFNPDSNKNQGIEEDLLFSGLITAIKTFMLEINVGEVQSFKTEAYDVAVYSDMEYAIIFLVKNPNFNEKSLKKLQQAIQNVLTGRVHESTASQTGEILDVYFHLVKEEYLKWAKQEKESSTLKTFKESLW